MVGAMTGTAEKIAKVAAATPAKKAPADQGFALTLSAADRKLLSADSLSTAVAKGGKALESYRLALSSAYRRMAVAESVAGVGKGVAAAYVVRTLDRAQVPAGADFDPKKHKGSSADIIAALRTVDADGLPVEVSKGRISQYRKTARLIFEVGFDPERDSDLGPISSRWQNNAAVAAVIDADGATVDKVRAAVAKAKVASVTTGRGGSGKSDDSGSGQATDDSRGAAEPKAPTVGQNNSTRMAAIRTNLAGMTNLTPAEWATLAEILAEVEAKLDASDNRAAGQAALAKRQAAAKREAEKATASQGSAQ